MPGPERSRAPRLPGFDYTSPRAYFLTLCTWCRAPVLCTVGDQGVALTPVGQLVERHLQALPGRYPGLHLDAHVLMPDHLHAILWLPDRQPRDLRQVVGLFKAGCTRDVRGRGGIHPALKTEIHPADGRGGIHPALWQRSFYDRVIRDDRELHALRRYIAENPIRWIHRNGAGFTEKGRDESRPYDHDDRAG